MYGELYTAIEANRVREQRTPLMPYITAIRLPTRGMYKTQIYGTELADPTFQASRSGAGPPLPE